MARIARQIEVRFAGAVAAVVPRGRMTGLAQAGTRLADTGEAAVSAALKVGESDRRGTAACARRFAAQASGAGAHFFGTALLVDSALSNHVVRIRERHLLSDQQ